MAYPTTIAWRETAPVVGVTSPVTITGSQGTTNGSQPVQTVTPSAGDTTQKFPLGTLTRFKDDNYGEIVAIYLKGVASTAAGDFVVYDPKAATTTRALVASTGPGAVALQPCVASQFGWYAVAGMVPVSAGSGIVKDEACATTSTDGQLTEASDTLNTAGNIIGLVCKAAVSGGFADCLLAYPSVLEGSAV